MLIPFHSQMSFFMCRIEHSVSNSVSYPLSALVATLVDYFSVLFSIPGLRIVSWGFV